MPALRQIADKTKPHKKANLLPRTDLNEKAELGSMIGAYRVD